MIWAFLYNKIICNILEYLQSFANNCKITGMFAKNSSRGLFRESLICCRCQLLKIPNTLWTESRIFSYPTASSPLRHPLVERWKYITVTFGSLLSIWPQGMIWTKGLKRTKWLIWSVTWGGLSSMCFLWHPPSCFRLLGHGYVEFISVYHTLEATRPTKPFITL